MPSLRHIWWVMRGKPMPWDKYWTWRDRLGMWLMRRNNKRITDKSTWQRQPVIRTPE